MMLNCCFSRHLTTASALVLTFFAATLGCSGDGDESSPQTTTTTAAGGDGAGGEAGAGGNSAGGSGSGGNQTSSCPTDASWTVGLQSHSAKAFEGYTLLAPLSSKTTYLIDMCGRQVHSWLGTGNPGNAVYLLEDGDLLRTESVGKDAPFNMGGTGGRVLRIGWDGTIKWKFEYASDQHRQHHDVELLPSGNILMIAWELKTKAEALAAGRKDSLLADGELWPDTVIEVEPQGAEGGKIVWEWHSWDHVIQDHAQGTNHGKVEDNPQLADLNFGTGPGADWLHVNGIDYNADLDQIVLSIHNTGEIWIIDHSTTTSQAASHSGGNSNMGGDLLYRWGNPRAYRAGEPTDQVFFGQHDAQWIAEGLAGAGNILVFNNGMNRPAGKYSTVDELTPPLSGYNYSLAAGQAYGPSALAWTYVAPTPTDFYSSNISGAHRLPNGNTIVCSGASGTLFEVTDDGEVVWEYINPVTQGGPLTQGEPLPKNGPGASNPVFRAYRFAPDYAGLAGHDLTPGDYIEKPAG